MQATKDQAVAVITAGGSGQRFGSQKPKQFLELAGVPLLIHTLRAFQASKKIARYILVLPYDHRDFFPEEYRKKFSLTKLDRVINGGPTRQASVLNGLQAVGEASVVAIHDGARCLIRASEIDRCIDAVEGHDGAVLAARMRDTVKQVENEKILRTIPRETLWGMQTPQVFRHELILKAYEKCAELGIDVTDDAAAMEKTGADLIVVESMHFNLKVTHAEDLHLAESILQRKDTSQ